MASTPNNKRSSKPEEDHYSEWADLIQDVKMHAEEDDTTPLSEADLMDLESEVALLGDKTQIAQSTRDQIFDVTADAIPEEDEEVFEEAKLLLAEPTINDGERAETLDQSMQHFELPGGIVGTAATSMAGYKYEIDKKTGKTKSRNEDRWYVNPDTGFVAIVDGMGGGDKGELAAEVLTGAIAENEDNVQAAADKTKQVLTNMQGGPNDGACFVAAKIEVGRPIELSQCGDVELYHYSSTGKLKYEPGDHLKLGGDAQSPFEKFELMRIQRPSLETVEGELGLSRGQYENTALGAIVERIMNNIKPVVTMDNPLYSNLRKSVLRAVTQKSGKVMTLNTKSTVEAGDWIVMMSDGVADNFSEAELQHFMNIVISQDWEPEQATQKLSEELEKRTKLRASEDPRALANHYKLDNASIIIMKVKRVNGNGLKKAA